MNILLVLLTLNAAIIKVQTASQCTTPPSGGANSDKDVACATVQSLLSCTATCDAGWMTSMGATTIGPETCNSGSYSTSLADCDTPQVCTAPSPLPVGITLIYDGGMNHGDVQVYGCIAGFEHTSETQTVTCSSGSYPSGEPQACTPINCNAIPDAPGTVASTSTTTYTGSPVTVTCGNGWELVTSSVNQIMCEISGQWEPSIWTFCQRKTCTQPSTLPAGVVLISDGGTQFEDVQVYGCLPGFEHYPSTQEVACGDGGYPDNQPEACTPINCGPIPDVPGTVVSPTITVYTGTPETVACDNGWELVTSSVNQIMCTVCGKWEPPIWTFCQRQTCTQPSTLPEGVELISDGGTQYEDVQVYGCLPGFEHNPSIQEVACGHDGYPDNQPEACTLVAGDTTLDDTADTGDTTLDDTAGAGDTTPDNTVGTGDSTFSIGMIIGAFCGGVGVAIVVVIGLSFLRQYSHLPTNVGHPYQMGNQSNNPNNRVLSNNPAPNNHSPYNNTAMYW